MSEKHSEQFSVNPEFVWQKDHSADVDETLAIALPDRVDEQILETAIKQVGPSLKRIHRVFSDEAPRLTAEEKEVLANPFEGYTGEDLLNMWERIYRYRREWDRLKAAGTLVEGEELPPEAAIIVRRLGRGDLSLGSAGRTMRALEGRSLSIMKEFSVRNENPFQQYEKSLALIGAVPASEWPAYFRNMPANRLWGFQNFITILTEAPDRCPRHLAVHLDHIQDMISVIEQERERRAQAV